MMLQAILILLVYSICYGNSMFPYRERYKTNSRDTCSTHPHIKDLELVYTDKDKKKYISKRMPKKLVPMDKWDMVLLNLGLNTYWDRFKGVTYKDGKMSIKSAWYLRYFFSTQYSSEGISLKPKWRNLICLGLVVLAVAVVGLVTGIWFFVLGAAFTSKATGDFDAVGQTTWNEANFPVTGDTFTVQNTHVVSIKGSEASGSGTIDAGGTLRFDGQADSVPAILNLDNGATLANSGAVDQLNTGSTGYASIAGVSAEPMTGTAPSLGNGYWKWDEVDFQMDITTGGGGCTFEFVDDCTIDQMVVTANDTLKCVIQDVTITCAALKYIRIDGTAEITGASGHDVVFTGFWYFIFADNSVADIQYATFSCNGFMCMRLGNSGTGSVTDTQLDNVSLTTTLAAGTGLHIYVTTVPTFTNSTFSGGDDSAYLKTDISIYRNCVLQLDTCTFTTVSMEQTGGWIAHITSGTMTIQGILASSETPAAGYRAADITGDLTTSQADQYSTPFNTSYTLGAAMNGTVDITTDASTTLATGNFQITASGDIDNQGTFTPGTGLFIMDGANKSLTGSWTFWHFTKAVAAADTLTFENGETYTFGGNVTINAAIGELLSLKSDSAGTSFSFVMSAGAVKANLSYLSVKDSDASGSDATQKPIAPSNSFDISGNTDWFPPLVGYRIQDETVVHTIIDGVTELSVSEGKVDVHGNYLILDADGDTFIDASIDDQIDYGIATVDTYRMDATAFKYLAGRKGAFYNAGNTEAGEIYRDNDYMYIESGAGATGIKLQDATTEVMRIVATESSMRAGIELAFYNAGETEHGEIYRDNDSLDIDSGTGGILDFRIASTLRMHITDAETKFLNTTSVQLQGGISAYFLNAGNTELGSIYRDNDYLYIDSGTGGTTKFYIVGVDVASLITNAFSLQEAAGDMYSNIYTYSATDGHMPSLDFYKSASDTLGTVAETGVGDYLGRLRFFGVNAAGPNAFAQGAQIYAIQMEAAGGVSVSTDIVFETVNGAGLGSLNTDQLRLKFDGSTRIGTTATYVEIDSGADFTFVGAGSGFPYAEIWVLGNAVATGIGGAGVFVQFTGFVNDGSFNNCTPDHTNDHITIIEPGDYLCVCSFHIESIGAGAADTVSIEIRKNNGTVVFNNLHAHRKLAGGGGDIGSISISGALPGVSNGDTIEVWLTNDSNATDILVADANLTISQIGGD